MSLECELNFDWMSAENTRRVAQVPMLELCSNRPHRPSQNYIGHHLQSAVSCSKHSKQRTYPNQAADSKSVEGNFMGVQTPPPGTISNTNILCGFRVLPRSLVRCVRGVSGWQLH